LLSACGRSAGAEKRAGRSFYIEKEERMKVENGVRVFAGIMILISVLLIWLVSKWWLLFTAFIGVNLIQSAFTGFCPPAILMKKLGMKE
jgi:hypothetical protein